MHNCRTTRDRITEILLSSSETGPTELDGCEECRGEFETLKETLRLTSRAIDATTPPKEDWSNYKSSLKLTLLNASTGSALTHHSAQRRENWLRRSLICHFTDFCSSTLSKDRNDPNDFHCEGSRRSACCSG